MEKQVKIYNLDIEYEVIHREIKYPRLELRTGKLCLILPKKFRNYNDLIEKHQNWIFKKMSFVNETQKKATNKLLNHQRTPEDLKKLVSTYAKKICKKYKIQPKKIIFRKMKSKWGSCSTNKNLTINTRLKYLPDDLIKYVILHEMIHIIERKHNQRFWKIISENFVDYESKERDLFIYWFLTQQIQE